MTDQPPTDHPDQEPTTGMVADQPADHGTVVGNQPPTDLNQPTEETAPAMVTLEDAAAALGITVNAVRQRIKRGTVVATKTEDGWLVDMVATNQRAGTDRPPTTATNQPTNHVVDPTNHQPTTDLTPIANVIREQHQQIAEQAERIAELSAAAAMWQTRALHLQEEVKQLKQLAASVEASESSESAEAGDQDADDGGAENVLHSGIWARLRRWWRQ